MSSHGEKHVRKSFLTWCVATQTAGGSNWNWYLLVQHLLRQCESGYHHRRDASVASAVVMTSKTNLCSAYNFAVRYVISARLIADPVISNIYRRRANTHRKSTDEVRRLSNKDTWK